MPWQNFSVLPAQPDGAGPKNVVAVWFPQTANSPESVVLIPVMNVPNALLLPNPPLLWNSLGSPGSSPKPTINQQALVLEQSIVASIGKGLDQSAQLVALSALGQSIAVSNAQLSAQIATFVANPTLLNTGGAVVGQVKVGP